MLSNFPKQKLRSNLVEKRLFLLTCSLLVFLLLIGYGNQPMPPSLEVNNPIEKEQPFLRKRM